MQRLYVAWTAYQQDVERMSEDIGRPAALATLIAALIHGLAARAAEGTSEAELLAAPEIAFAGWPSIRFS